MIDSKRVYDGKIISVRVDKVQINGRETTREVIEHSGAAAVLPLIGNMIIMEKQYRYAVEKELYEIPAGTLEKGESPAECAKRELIEETGYKAGNLELLGQCYMTPGYSTEIIYFFVANDLQEVKIHEMDVDEQITIVKINIDDAVKMVLNGKIQDAKTAYAILTYKSKG
ncbi:MAG: ADP-ribose pyrophosphatase [Thaumarchaeota archaeon]|nr:ADP-ribose pyrophosphatase [Nitrososphaerota archaeon]|tara:strand:- start:1091 stop:1600 length:510 start_codon:yes stop_codon:yes gene_type:complete